jgi:ABC-type phosphate transport system substrate-binding protein
VELVGGGAVVSNLPDGVGIVELTLYTQKATNPGALLVKGKKATLRAQTTSAGAPVSLSAVLVGKGR